MKLQVNFPYRIWLILIVCTLLGCSLTQSTVVFQGTSMFPTIKSGERVQTEKLSAEAKVNLARGEILVFKYPKDPTKAYIKRLIGLPGDTVEIRGNEVWVNGSKLSEPYLASPLNLAQISNSPVTVPAHQYYLLGDNRDNSSDSRFWGFVPEELLVARVVNR